jgi:hypothetical protein
MKTAKHNLVGFLVIVFAAVSGQIMCAPLKKGVLLNPQVFAIMVAFSGASFVVFSVTRNIPSRLAQVLAGLGGSYLAFLGILFIFAAIKDETAEALLWLPAMIVFGIPLMAPLVGLSWFASTLAFGRNRK